MKSFARLTASLTLPLALSSLLALPAVAGEPATKPPADDSAEVSSADLHFGEPVGDGEVVSIEALLDDPEGWSGQEVVVEGAVVGVCEKAGCWMEIEGETASIRFKVDDGVMVFPVDAMGRHARARGRVEMIDMERERFVAWRAHLAEERGEAFDESMIDEGPYRIVRLRGLGASVSGS